MNRWQAGGSAAWAALWPPVWLALYGLATTALQPLLRRKLARRARAEPGYAVAVEERFGHYTEAAREGGWIWVHAVSLGETRAATTLVQALRQALPDMRLLLTHGTATGREAGAALLRPGDVQAWAPWDSPGAVRRFLAHFRPRLGLLMETEVWPQLVAQTRAAGVPLCLVNARLSEKSLRQAQRLGPLARGAYGGLAAVWAQSADDAQRLRALGAPVQGVMGNFKFDVQPDGALLTQGLAWRQAQKRPVLLLTSSREGEEALWAHVYAQKQALPLASTGFVATKTVANTKTVSVQWLIVPRHPQRFDEVEALLRQAGLRVLRRSQWPQSTEQPLPEADVWLGDSLGEMALYYGLADVALLGGSFEPLGGQNLIEAAACACPIVMGPHVFNFAQASELALQAGAAWQVPDMEAAVAQALELVAAPATLAQARAAAQDMALAHRGATARTCAAVLALLKPAP